jgi:uncharacterized coiled-coil DUF342 family protein
MSEAEQNETPQRTEDEWVELEEELAEMRKKRDQLDAQNLRVTDNLRRTIEERDTAVKMTAAVQCQVASLQEQLRGMAALRAEYLATKEAANTNSDNAASLREQLAEMTASRDKFEQLCKEWRIEFDALNAKKDGLQVELGQWQVGYDAIKEQLVQAKERSDMFEAENTSLRDTIQQLRAKQVHGDLPGLLMAIQLAAEQARLSI